jgi:lactoylglutathione lyase
MTNNTIFVELYVTSVESTISALKAIFDVSVPRHEGNFAEVRHGSSTLLLNGQPVSDFGAGNPIHALPKSLPRGAGVELCFEVDDTDDCHRRALADDRWVVTASPRDRSWGLRDFRVAHPDGYYIRITSKPTKT